MKNVFDSRHTVLKFNNFFKDSYFCTLELNRCVVKNLVRINASSKEQPK